MSTGNSASLSHKEVCVCVCERERERDLLAPVAYWSLTGRSCTSFSAAFKRPGPQSFCAGFTLSFCVRSRCQSGAQSLPVCSFAASVSVHRQESCQASFCFCVWQSGISHSGLRLWTPTVNVCSSVISLGLTGFSATFYSGAIWKVVISVHRQKADPRTVWLSTLGSWDATPMTH